MQLDDRVNLLEIGSELRFQRRYYWAVSDDFVSMLLMYPKSQRDDPSAEQKKVLASLVREEFR